MIKKILFKSKIKAVFLEDSSKLTAGQKVAMRGIFSDVMKGLSFYAREEFIDKLFESPIIILMYQNGDMVGFGTACRREAAGYDVTHILSAYVIKECQRNGVMMNCFRKFIRSEAIRNRLCVVKPLYITASTVNPQVLKAMAKIADVWPNFNEKIPVPDDVQEIIYESIDKYYPAGNSKPFQAEIAESMAGVREDSADHSTGDSDFDEKFYQIAVPKERKLLVFCARITKDRLWKLFRPQVELSRLSGLIRHTHKSSSART
ncbi:hypothetical protein [Alcanivorax sp.]|uniref:hypothetical protein n=1 Tax=Alcanivorax sp. TaxID=1872427 RepID=UPI002B264937|nr:hypothetical protein [Alcanivorax sp.]